MTVAAPSSTNQSQGQSQGQKQGQGKFSPDAFIDALRDANMKPQELADAMGASVAAIARWMAGIASPKPGYATHAAAILDIDVDDLYE